ncbi:MAG: tRNA pseudouridine(54/55) synthase Pus10 [Candidatus Bipolaricaulota bacterium]|nr:tRNA pseudouridine(54/55) synthase Pus10 [Candidatus Bipolaricaulota bacterium]
MDNPEIMGARVLKQATEILRSGPICDDCLGRAFAGLGHGLTNRTRGKSLRTLLMMLGVPEKDGQCWVCGGVFSRIESLAARAVSQAEGIEYETYLFGTKITTRLEQTEGLFNEKFDTGQHESLKHALNRALGKAFERQIGHGTVDFNRPHLNFTIDLTRDEINLRVRPVYIYGRYCKLTRGIPQTHWPCRHCKGKGCDMCHGTGKQYPESVEELIATPLLAATGAKKATLHGAGREDIDARMLGDGRPFVLELRAPVYRTLELEPLQREINTTTSDKVKVHGLRFVERDTVARIKQQRADKTYRALVQFAADVDKKALTGAVTGLIGTINQRTPLRVAHRRADLVRQRRVLDAEGALLSPRQAEVRIRGEGGLYIKELISGDNGRTQPSLADLLGTQTQVLELDVLSVSVDYQPD